MQGQNQNRGNLPALDLGPKLAVSVNSLTPNPSVENNTTITLQVFGLLPHRVSLFQTVYTNFSGLNCSDNGYDIQLLNITVIGDSETVFLSPLFLSVAEAWQIAVDAAEDGLSTIREETIISMANCRESNLLRNLDLLIMVSRP